MNLWALRENLLLRFSQTDDIHSVDRKPIMKFLVLYVVPTLLVLQLCVCFNTNIFETCSTKLTILLKSVQLGSVGVLFLGEYF